MKKYFIPVITAVVLALILSGCGSLLTSDDTSTAKGAIDKMELLLSGEYDADTEQEALKALENASKSLKSSASSKMTKAKTAKDFEKAAYPQKAYEAVSDFISDWKNGDVAGCRENANLLRTLAGKNPVQYEPAGSSAAAAPSANSPQTEGAPTGDSALHYRNGELQWYIAEGDFTLQITGDLAGAEVSAGDPDTMTVGELHLPDAGKCLKVGAEKYDGKSYADYSDEDLEEVLSYSRSSHEELLSGSESNYDVGVLRSGDIVWIWETGSYDDVTYYFTATLHNNKLITLYFEAPGEMTEKDRAEYNKIVESLRFGKY